jgi:hypothetical protein
MDKKNLNMINHELYKKMLCNNIIKERECSYKSKCMYAHSIEEQKLCPIRQRAYDMFKQTDLSHIDLRNDQELYNTLLLLTNICNKCSNGTCYGGYNCKHGCINYQYKICSVDLLNGTCNNNNCKSIHFTKKGLKPLNAGTPNYKNKNINNEDGTDSESIDSIFNKSSESDNDINSIFIYK